MKWNYPHKVWLTTVFVAPVVWLIVLFIKGQEFAPFGVSLTIIMTSVIFGAGLSLPSLWLYGHLSRDLIHSGIQPWVKKFIFSFVGLLLVWITFYVISRTSSQEVGWDPLALAVCYSLVQVLAAFFYRLDRQKVFHQQRQPEDSAQRGLLR
jgi:uncharacterized membrane-anchored protein